MSNLMDVEEVKRQYESEKAISFEKPAPPVAPPAVAEDTMNKIVGQAVLHQMGDEGTQKRVLKTADKVINTQISKIENQAEQGEKEAIFQNNKDACDLYGIDEKTVPKWVVKAARFVQNFWYLVWLVVGSVTTAPIVFLGKKIKVVIKRTWVAMLFAVLIYVALLFMPVWAEWFNLK